MQRLDWYFDFISPFAWFAWNQLPSLPPSVRVQPRPLLFAGLLDHWGQKGPAEIPPKRRWTYRWCAWWAMQHGVPFLPPAAHPFNPLPYLRLSIAAGNTPEAIDTIFRAVWTSGDDLARPEVWQGLARRLGVDVDRLAAPELKAELRANTEDAAARGVFGVPTLMIGDEAFWGVDGMAFARAALEDPALLESESMRLADKVPLGVIRPRGAHPG